MHYEGKVRQQREEQYLKTRKEHTFKVGDLVWLYTQSSQEGLAPKLKKP